jgi:hypothetical protein
VIPGRSETAERTLHEVRLARMLPMLVRTFGGARSEAELRACADAILEDYDAVPTVGFAMSSAYRRTCQCLRDRHCPSARAG